MHESRPRSRGCLWAAVAVCALLIVAGTILALAAMALGRGFPLSHHGDDWGADDFPDLNEIWAFGSGDTKAVVVPIRGFIALDEIGSHFGAGADSAQLALLSIRRATHDPDVRALILDIDSGGGGITASDMLYNAVREFREEDPERVVVALFGDVAASGAYYVAAAADHIVARPTSVTGSIGVLLQSLNLRELGTRIGVRDVTIKSGPNKDLLNPLQDLTEEQRAMLQAIVDELHARFVQIVAERRDLPPEQVRALADGRVVTAAEALRAGLVDEIGYWEDAQRAAAKLLDVEEVKVYRYREEFSLYAFLEAVQRWSPIASWPEGLGRVRLLYHWQL